MPMRTNPLVALLSLLPVLSADAQTRLTARELFYAPPAKAEATKSGHGSKSRKSGGDRIARRDSQPAAVTAPSPAPAGGAAESMGAQVMPAAYSEESAFPLGLRYSLLKRNEDGDYSEVDIGAIFHAGDKIRLRVETNDTAYLYIVIRGSSGTWKVLFPSEEITGGSNVVERGRHYDLPPGGRFAFDGQPGEEKLFLVLSRQPEPSLENLIYSLSATPAEGPPKAPKQLMLAENTQPITDDMVGQLRGKVLARDLVFEKVDDQTAGDRKEKAVYVVNPSRKADARLVADLVLQHR